MGLVTLLTDWGQRSPQLAAIKGNVLHELPDTTFVDISHVIPAFDLIQASYIFSNTYRHFPENTVHFVGLDSIAADKIEAVKHYLIIKQDGHYFIGPDSGFFSLVFDVKPDEIVRVSIDRSIYKYHFNIDLVKYISALLGKTDIYDLGDKSDIYTEKEHFKPIVEQNKTIRGSIIHVDDFGNVITNIKKSFFDKVCGTRSFSIALRKSEYHITQMSNWYDDVGRDDILAMFNAADHLEIALNQGNASGLIGLYVDDKIRIDFHDN